MPMAGRRHSLRKSSRASLTAYNCDGAMLLPTDHEQSQTGGSSSSTTPPRGSEPELETPEPSETPSGREEAPGRGPRRSRRSPGNRALRGRTRMSLAGYNCIGAVSINAEDASSTRDSTNTGSLVPEQSTPTQSEADSLIREPWNALRRWAADTLSEDTALDGDESDRDTDLELMTSPRNSLEPRSSTRRSMRVASRASLAGYSCQLVHSCQGATSSNQGDDCGSDGEHGAEHRDRLSTIGETLNIGISQWFGESENSNLTTDDLPEQSVPVFSLSEEDEDAHIPLMDVFDQQADTARRSSLEDRYEALEGVTASENTGDTWQQMLFGNEEDDDETLEMGLQDDPIAEAGFVFAVEYGRSYAYATTHHVRERDRLADDESD